MTTPEEGWERLKDFPLFSGTSHTFKHRYHAGCSVIEDPNNNGPDKIVIFAGISASTIVQDGVDITIQAKASTILYDIPADEWSHAGDLPRPLEYIGAVASLEKGKVLSLGGEVETGDSSNTQLDVVYEFSYITSNWTELPIKLLDKQYGTVTN